MSIKSHANPAVSGVLKATKGHVSWDLVYLPPEAAMKKGYEILRATVIWVSEQTGRSIPEEAQEVLRWLRAHVGSDEDKRAAIKKYRGVTPEVPSECPISQANSSSKE